MSRAWPHPGGPGRRPVVRLGSAHALLVFAATGAAFHPLPALVSAWSSLPHEQVEARVGAPPGDLVDLVTPFVILGAAALVLWTLRAGRAAITVAAVAGVLYVDGHGIHLAANSIAADPIHPRGAADRAYFFDERLGHTEWHLGWLGLLIAFVLADRRPSRIRLTPALGTVALLAPSLAAITIEGQTWWLIVALAPAFWLVALRTRGHVAVTCAAGVGAAALGIALWALWWRGVPQLTEIALIPYGA